MATIQLAGEAFTPSSLASVYQADTAAMDKVDATKKAYEQALVDQKAAHARTAEVNSALRSFLLGYFGKKAVAVLGDFDMKAPSTGTMTVATKAVAVAKAKATRAARGTKGPKAKLAVTGNVDAKAIEAAINTPTPVPAAPAAHAAPGDASPAAPSPAIPAAPAAPATPHA